MSNIYTKLLNVQKAIGPIAKDAENPFFKSKYFNINSLISQLNPILHNEGLVLTQPIIDGKVNSVLTDTETKESVSSGIELPELNDPQKMGSCITYYRRYTLQSLLALEAEDDDGNKASGSAPNQKTAQKDDDNKPWLNHLDRKKDITPQWGNVIDAINDGKITSVQQIRKHYKVSKEEADKLEGILNHQQA